MSDISFDSPLKISFNLTISNLYLLYSSTKMTNSENSDIFKHVEIINF